MELKTFKKNINDFLKSKGFTNKGSSYYLFLKDILIVVGLQKSNFTKGYYLNIGYIIMKLNPLINNPTAVGGDVRARFSIQEKGKCSDFFDLEILGENDKDWLNDQLDINFKKYIEPVVTIEGLKKLLKINPVMLYQTKLVAKQLLGFE